MYRDRYSLASVLVWFILIGKIGQKRAKNGAPRNLQICQSILGASDAVDTSGYAGKVLQDEQNPVSRLLRRSQRWSKMMIDQRATEIHYRRVCTMPKIDMRSVLGYN